MTTGQLSQVSNPAGGRLGHGEGLTTIPGDPTDTSIVLRPLEPASGQALARDLVLKTRRRKGLGDQIAVSKYLDDEFVVSFLSRMTLRCQQMLMTRQLALSASGHSDLLG